MSDEQFEQFLAKEAKEYRKPPETPREAMWARIQAARQAARSAPTEVVDLATRRPARRTWYLGVIAAAAVLAIGIAIGRSSVTHPTQVAAHAAPDSAALERTRTVMRVAAGEHFSRVEALLTDYETGHIGADFQPTARDLLARTRLLIDTKRLTDPALRRLLEDLELVLVQVSRLDPADQGRERRMIDDGITERQVRSRLRNAIPAGPTA